MAYNSYQQLHFTALYGAKRNNAPTKSGQYALFENGNKVMEDAYGLLVWKKKEMMRNGSLEYLLKIKAI